MHLTNSNVSSSSYSNKVITDPHHLASQCSRVLLSRNITQQNENIFSTGIIWLKAVWHWTSQKIFKYYQTGKEWLKNYQHYLTFTKVEFLKNSWTVKILINSFASINKGTMESIQRASTCWSHLNLNVHFKT